MGVAVSGVGGCSSRQPGTFETSRTEAGTLSDDVSGSLLMGAGQKNVRVFVAGNVQVSDPDALARLTFR
jgi:hypothetical protein